jgi:hypothetical protein
MTIYKYIENFVRTPIPTASLESLARRDRGNDALFGIDSKGSEANYPIKLLRYLFIATFLDDEFRRLKRPLRICEIGVDRGQMYLFLQHHFNTVYGMSDTRSYVERWDAVSVDIPEDVLRARGYDGWTQVDIESADFKLTGTYDVIILCHILEHLFDPERVVQVVTPNLSSDGSVVGGMPVTPHIAAPLWQSRIRKRALQWGHVSVFSPRRIQHMASLARLECDSISGAFCVRSTGSRFENVRGWVVANLVFGKWFPGWPGEIYWRMKNSAQMFTGAFLAFLLADAA